jgi:hypothetical protein
MIINMNEVMIIIMNELQKGWRLKIETSIRPDHTPCSCSRAGFSCQETRLLLESLIGFMVQAEPTHQLRDPFPFPPPANSFWCSLPRVPVTNQLCPLPTSLGPRTTKHEVAASHTNQNKPIIITIIPLSEACSTTSIALECLRPYVIHLHTTLAAV